MLESDEVVKFWSAIDGGLLFEIRVQIDCENEELLRHTRIQSMSWSSSSRFLTVQTSFPSDDLLVIDVEKRRLVQ